MFQKRDIYWVGLACSLMVGGYSMIWSSEPEIRSFRLKDEITAQQESSDSEVEAEAIRGSIFSPVLKLAKTNHYSDSTVQD